MKQKLADFPFSPSKLRIFYGWPILIVGSLGVVMSVPGQTMGVSVFTDSLIEALRLSRSQLSTAYMFGTLGSACLLPLGGNLYDRWGARTTTAVACVSLALMLLFLSQCDVISRSAASFLSLSEGKAAFAVMLVGFFGIRFWGQGILTLASRNMVAKWFDRKRGLASGLSGVFVTLGLSISPLALSILIGWYGWRGAWVALAAVVGGGFTLVALVLYRDNPEDCGLRPDGVNDAQAEETSRTAAEEPCWTRKEATRTWAFWAFSLSLALYGLYGTGFTFHIVSIFEAAGMTQTQAVATFLPVSLVAVVVHLGAGWISDRMGLRALLVALLVGLGVSAAGLAFLRPGLPVVLLIVGNGVSGGLFGLLSAVTWAKFFGRRYLGAIGGLHMSVAVLFSAFGPVLFSQALAWTGSYRAAAIACLAAAGVLFVKALRISQPAQSPPEPSTCASGAGPEGGPDE